MTNKGGKKMQDGLRIINPEKLSTSGKIPCDRIQVGGRMGYKPNMVRLSDGELLMTNFHTHFEVNNDGSMCEHIVLHRSSDAGKTWISQHYDHLWGREPYLNVFSDGTLIITTHFLTEDVRNQTGHCNVWLHRSEDRGHTWKSRNLDIDQIPADVSATYSSRNIIELDDGSYVMGVGCGNDNDFLFISKDKGTSWKIAKMRISGFDNNSYKYSILQEGIFFRTNSNRVLLFARCDIRQMNFDRKIPGLPEFDFSETSDSDHYDVEIIFESKDNGISWEPLNAVPLVGCMYPSICDSGGGKYLFTFTQRIPNEKMRMGVYAFFLEEQENGFMKSDPGHDLIVIDEKTPDYLQSGGGFGNTLMLDDGSFITPYSYLDADPEIEELMKTGRFRDQDTFNFYRDKALQYYRGWVNHVTWERTINVDHILQYHHFLGCCRVLNLCGPVTEVAKWKLVP